MSATIVTDKDQEDCEHVIAIRKVRTALAFELVKAWQQTSKWQPLRRAKLEGGMDALNELADRLYPSRSGTIAPLYPFKIGEACPQCDCRYDGTPNYITPGCHCVCHD